MQIVSTATQIFSLLTIVCQVTVVILILAVFIKTAMTRKVLTFFAKHALRISFLVALVATLGSLFYSEIAHFEPCKLCWYQRILMYPQSLLLAIAYGKKDKNIGIYSIVLSSLGIVIALYHYLLQIGTIGEILPCTTV